jgi:hypothetical protein
MTVDLDAAQSTPEPIVCPNCRSTNPYGAQFCSRCGTSFGWQTPVATGPMPQYPMPPGGVTIYNQQASVGPVDSMGGLATASLVLGIVGLVLSLFLAYCTLPITITGAVMGGIALKSTTRRGQALAGLIMSILGIVVAILWAVWLASIIAGLPTSRR